VITLTISAFSYTHELTEEDDDIQAIQRWERSTYSHWGDIIASSEPFSIINGRPPIQPQITMASTPDRASIAEPDSDIPKLIEMRYRLSETFKIIERFEKLELYYPASRVK